MMQNNVHYDFPLRRDRHGSPIHSKPWQEFGRCFRSFFEKHGSKWSAKGTTAKFMPQSQLVLRLGEG
jgi:hypothetical protein